MCAPSFAFPLIFKFALQYKHFGVCKLLTFLENWVHGGQGIHNSETRFVDARQVW